MSIKDVLSFPRVYSGLMSWVGGNSRQQHLDENIRPFSGCRILDVGCGPADVLDYLPPDVDYVGVDLEPKYIEFAKEKYGLRGRFICENVDALAADNFENFDIVLANGLIHHLDDEQSVHLLEVARQALKPDGYVVTWDGCYRRGQSPIAKWMLDNDRGQFVREESCYLKLAKHVFGDVDVIVRDDYLRIPYTIIVMRCFKGARAPFEQRQDYVARAAASSRVCNSGTGN